MSSGKILGKVCNFDPTIHKRLENKGSLARGLEALPEHSIVWETPPNLKFIHYVMRTSRVCFALQRDISHRVCYK